MEGIKADTFSSAKDINADRVYLGNKGKNVDRY
jgi:hypothetical protein